MFSCRGVGSGDVSGESSIATVLDWGFGAFFSPKPLPDAERAHEEEVHRVSGTIGDGVKDDTGERATSDAAMAAVRETETIVRDSEARYGERAWRYRRYLP